jgi:hypothetical protein
LTAGTAVETTPGSSAIRKKPAPYNFANLTAKNGELLKTPIRAEGRIGAVTLQGGAGVTLGDHPIVWELGPLKLRPWTFERLDADGP